MANNMILLENKKCKIGNIKNEEVNKYTIY